MSVSIRSLDIYPEEDGSYLVFCKNKKKLLYDGLRETFQSYGKVLAITDKGHRNIYIRYFKKESALNCFYDLSNNPDFLVELPHKCISAQEEEDHHLSYALNEEAMIGFHKPEPNVAEERQEDSVQKLNSEEFKISFDSENHYERRTRNIIQSRAFKRFIIALAACNQYKRVRDDRESLILELKYQMRGVKFDLKTGFADEISDDSQEMEIPQLMLAKDLYYFQNVNIIRATDVLICNLPPWYQEVNLYKFLLPLVPNDFLGLEWYRMFAAGTKECSFPYAIVYLKTHHSACKLRYSADGLVLDYRRISVCLMEDVEAMLVELKQ